MHNPRGLRRLTSARVGLATALAMSGSLVGSLPTNDRVVFYVAQLGWLPLAALAAFAAQRRDGAAARYVGPLSDLAMAATVTIADKDLQLVAILGAGVATAQALLWWYELPTSTGPVVATVVTSIAVAVHGWSIVTAVGVMTSVVVVGVVWLSLHVAARREREVTRFRTELLERADTITAAVPHPILVTNATGGLRQWNAAARNLMLSKPAPGTACAELLGLHAGERPLDCSNGCALLALTSGGEEADLWQPVTAESDERRPLLASAAVVGTGVEGESEVVHSLRDITRLKQADEAKTLFLATASHELKTPLTVIRGFADMLLKHPELDVERRQSALTAISRRSRDLTAIVDRILLSSRIEAGRLSLTLTNVDAGTLVQERVHALAEATGRSISSDQVEGPMTVLANEAALTTVIDHLLDNALKYSEGAIVTGVRPVEGGMELCVGDHGVGMDEEQAEHCFDKFWQADSSDSRRHGGTGIGLYIVRSLIEAMRGAISVQSAPGQGTEFRILLPTTPVDVPTQRDGERSQEPEPSMVREFMKQLGLPVGGAR